MQNSNTLATLKLSWADVERAVDIVAEKVKHVEWDTILGVMRGGMVPARMVAARLGVRNIAMWDGEWTMGEVYGKVLVVDDIADTGDTVVKAKRQFGAPVAVLVAMSPEADYFGVWLGPDNKQWVIFPWEGRDDMAGKRQSEECACGGKCGCQKSE